MNDKSNQFEIKDNNIFRKVNANSIMVTKKIKDCIFVLGYINKDKAGKLSAVSVFGMITFGNKHSELRAWLEEMYNQHSEPNRIANKIKTANLHFTNVTQ